MQINLWPLGIILYLVFSAVYSFRVCMSQVSEAQARPYGRRMILDYIGVVICCFCWGMQSVTTQS